MAKTQTFSESCSAIGGYPYASHFTLYVTLTNRDGNPNTNKSYVDYHIYCESDGPGSISADHQMFFSTSQHGVVFDKVEYVQESSPNAYIEIGNGTLEATHNPDGTGSLNFEVSIDASAEYGGGGYGLECTFQKTFTLENIPRYTTIKSFTVSKRNETSVTCNFSTANICDYAWYSTNNGSTWHGYDISDGTSGSFNVTGLSPNTTYNFKLRVRRKDSQLTTDSGTVTQTTYKAPTQGLNSKTENTIQMNWHLDNTADYIWYSTNNGSTWTAIGSINGTDGAYVITGLSAGTTYNIKTRLRRKSSQTTYDTGAIAIATYNYPYVSAISKNPLTIGNAQTLTLYNPLSRSVTVKMNQNSASGTQLYSGTTSGTSISFTPNANTLYATIPNSVSGNCVYSVIYGSSKKSTTVCTYKIVGTEKPIFSNFDFQNVNTTIYNGGKTLYDLTGNNQIIVKGFSNIRATVTAANKATATNYASMKNYSLTVGTKVAENSTLTYPLNMTANAVDGQNVIVAAVDTRGTSTAVIKQATFKNYTDLAISNFSLARNDNGAGTNAIISFRGTFWNNSFGAINNTIVSATFKYRKTNESAWSSEYAITPTISGNTYSATITTSATFDLNSSYYIAITIKDYLRTKTASSTIGAGTPALTIYKDNVAIGNQYNTNLGGKLQINGITYGKQFVGFEGGTWITSRDHAICKNGNTNVADAYYPVLSQKTKDGEWSIGNLSNDNILRFCYTTDANYSTGTNSNVQWELDNQGNFNIIAKNVSEKKSLTSKSHSGGTNSGYVPDMSFIAYWNGAYNSSNSSNITYAHEGTIQCKPTVLYNNSSGTNGTVTLSQSAAKFIYIEIFFRSNDATTNVSSIRIYAPNGKSTFLNYIFLNPGDSSIYFKTSNVTISDTSITFSVNRQHYYADGVIPGVVTANNIYIVRVNGWK